MKITINIILSFFIKLSIAQYVFSGYTNKLSYRNNDEVTFFLNSEVGIAFDANLGLNDVNGGDMGITLPTLNIPIQNTINLSNPWEDGFGYTANTVHWTIPSYFTLKSGLYFLSGTTIPIIIKGDMNAEDIVIVIPTNTDAAYSNIGGKSLYEKNSTNQIASTKVSFLRPLPLSSNTSSQRKYYLSFLQWFTTQYLNYNISVISDMDMDDYNEISHARLLIVIGHSEYWTRKARLNFDRFVDNGKDAVFLSGDAMGWQVRYSGDKTQMICHRRADMNTDGNSYVYKGWDDDPICDPLLNTNNWWYPSLKYSVLSSIGAYWDIGGYGNHEGCYGGFNGHKILLPQSPLLSNTNFNYHDVLTFTTGEYDGTIISNADSNDGHIIGNGGDPILDVTGLGFYRAELIGYDQTTYDPNKIRYCPFIAFQKNCSSGKIINVSSNFWCSDIGIGGTIDHTTSGHPFTSCPSYLITPDYTNIRQITTNMIDLLLSGSNIFSNAPPVSFSIKPSPINVSYSACHHGSIDITPCGVSITPDEGYRIDQVDGTFVANVIDCTNCDGHDSRLVDYNNVKGINSNNNNQTNVNLFPNPNTGEFTIKINYKSQGTYRFVLTDISGRQITDRNDLINGTNTLDESMLDQGLYIYKVYSSNELIGNGKIAKIKGN